MSTTLSIHPHIGAAILVVCSLCAAYFNRIGDQSHFVKRTAESHHIRTDCFPYWYVQPASVLCGLFSFFVSSPWLIQVDRPATVAYCGVALMGISTAMLIEAKIVLSKKHDGWFEPYLPHARLKGGLYRFIRHPDRTANVVFLVSLFIASGTLLVLVSAVILAFFYRDAALSEEKALALRFPGYARYQEMTGMFLPKISRIFSPH